MAVNIKDITLDQINQWLKVGTKMNAPREIVDYLDMMDKVRGMYLRTGDFGTKQAIIRHLQHIDGLSYHVANNLYNNTLEYFYCDTAISKKAWRNIYADKLDALATYSIQTMKGPKDAKAVADIVKAAMLARELDKEDPQELPQELFQKPTKLYAMDPEFIGLAKIDRQRIARHIDSLPEISERQKERLKQDAGIIDITLFQDEQEDIREQE